MSPSDCTYNGWTNYETWNVNLWIDNGAGTSAEWRDQAAAIADGIRHDNRRSGGDNLPNAAIRDDVVSELADAMKTQIEDSILENVYGMAHDLLGAAIGQVNWREIAGHYADDALDAS